MMPGEIVDSYRTLAAASTHEIKIKGSRFIGLAYPVGSVDDASAVLEDVRKKEYNATHHCYAWTVGIEQEEFKYSDDGEPSGTAGRPIYNAIIGRGLKNVMVIVVRYYGGTKLGTGGLTRAYGGCAADVLDSADITDVLICDRLSFTMPFSLYDRVLRIIIHEQFTIVSQDFAEDVTMVLDIRKSKTVNFVARMTELSGGQLDIKKDS